MSSTLFSQFYNSLSYNLNAIKIVRISITLEMVMVRAQACQTTKHKSHSKHHIVVIIIAFSIIKYPILK